MEKYIELIWLKQIRKTLSVSIRLPDILADILQYLFFFTDFIQQLSLTFNPGQASHMYLHQVQKLLDIVKLIFFENVLNVRLHYFAFT